MQRLGFIHDMLDVKILILYVTSRASYPMTMQEIYEAGQIENMLKNHKSIYIQDEMEGKVFCEKYLSFRCRHFIFFHALAWDARFFRDG